MLELDVGERRFRFLGCEQQQQGDLSFDVFRQVFQDLRNPAIPLNAIAPSKVRVDDANPDRDRVPAIGIDFRLRMSGLVLSIEKLKDLLNVVVSPFFFTFAGHVKSFHLPSEYGSRPGKPRPSFDYRPARIPRRHTSVWRLDKIDEPFHLVATP